MVRSSTSSDWRPTTWRSLSPAGRQGEVRIPDARRAGPWDLRGEAGGSGWESNPRSAITPDNPMQHDQRVRRSRGSASCPELPPFGGSLPIVRS